MACAREERRLDTQPIKTDTQRTVGHTWGDAREGDGGPFDLSGVGGESGGRRRRRVGGERVGEEKPSRGNVPRVS